MRYLKTNKMTRRKSATKETYSSNCIQERNFQQRNKDLANLEKVKEYEKELKKQGKRQVTTDHPTIFRTKIISWI